MAWKHQLYLHVYAQHTNHQESCIVGNRQALLELRNLIDQALIEGKVVGSGFFSSDDEGYEMYVAAIEDEDVFQSLEMPYTEQYGGHNDHKHFINLKNDPNAPYDAISVFQDTDERIK